MRKGIDSIEVQEGMAGIDTVVDTGNRVGRVEGVGEMEDVVDSREVGAGSDGGDEGETNEVGKKKKGEKRKRVDLQEGVSKKAKKGRELLPTQPLFPPSHLVDSIQTNTSISQTQIQNQQQPSDRPQVPESSSNPPHPVPNSFDGTVPLSQIATLPTAAAQTPTSQPKQSTKPPKTKSSTHPPRPLPSTTPRPTPPEILKHLVIGINEITKALEMQIEILRLRLMIMSDAIDGTLPGVSRFSTLKGKEVIRGNEKGGLRLQADLPRSEVGREGDRGKDDGGEDGVEGEWKGNGNLLPTAPLSPLSDVDLPSGSASPSSAISALPQLSATQTPGQSVPLDTSLNHEPNPSLDPISKQSLQPEPGLNHAINTTNSPSNILPTQPYTSIVKQTITSKPPILYIFLPIPDINPPTLISPLSTYCATYNNLIFHYNKLEKSVRSRLKGKDVDRVLGLEEDGFSNAYRMAVSDVRDGKGLKGGGVLSAEAGSIRNVGGDREDVGRGRVGREGNTRREEVRIVPLGSVEAEISGLIGLRRVACLGIRVGVSLFSD